jgi:hypothetical protein
MPSARIVEPRDRSLRVAPCSDSFDPIESCECSWPVLFPVESGSAMHESCPAQLRPDADRDAWLVIERATGGSARSRRCISRRG